MPTYLVIRGRLVNTEEPVTRCFAPPAPPSDFSAAAAAELEKCLQDKDLRIGTSPDFKGLLASGNVAACLARLANVARCSGGKDRGNKASMIRGRVNSVNARR